MLCSRLSLENRGALHCKALEDFVLREILAPELEKELGMVEILHLFFHSPLRYILIVVAHSWHENWGLQLKLEGKNGCEILFKNLSSCSTCMHLKELHLV